VAWLLWRILLFVVEIVEILNSSTMFSKIVYACIGDYVKVSSKFFV